MWPPSLYEPLRPGEIRVIDLPELDQGENEVKSGCVWGFLRVVRLDDEPRYSALSYVWGQQENPPQHWFIRRPSPSSPSSSSCLSQPRVPITADCWSALRHLICMYGLLTIWVDATCINQHNEAEKLRQIPLIGRI